MIKRTTFAVCGALFAFFATACVPDPANPPPGGTSAAASPSPAAQAFWVGATITGIEFPLTAENGGRSAGVRIDFLFPGGAAETAGLHEGDVILTYDGKPTGTAADLIGATNGAAAKPAPVTLLRDGRPLTLTVTAQPRPVMADTIFQDARRKKFEAEQTAAADAQTAGNLKAAFDHDVRALRLLFGFNDPNATASYNADLARIAAILPRLPSPPGSLVQADLHNRRALAILKSATTDDDNDRAAREFWAAIYEAPWLADLYLNLGLVEAKAGYPERATGDLRRYLLLKPKATDTVAVEQKIAEQEVLSDERKPWYPFLTTWTYPDGDVKVIRLRGRQLKVVVTKGGGFVKTGDVLCSGTIHGSKFQGKCATYSTDEAVKCFGPKFDVDAEGEIAANTLTIRNRGDINFNPQTCALNYQRWQVYLSFHPAPSPTTKS